MLLKVSYNSCFIYAKDYHSIWFADDESDNENENFDEDDKSSLISSLSNADEEREINYDSEENEVVLNIFYILVIWLKTQNEIFS